LPDGTWRQESTRAESKREAERLLAFKVYQSSAGMLPGTASIEQIIEHFLRDARVRGLRAVARLERACKRLLERLEGYRAEQIDRARWLKYLDERQSEAAPDTVHFELSVARRVYRVAIAAGLVRAMPDIPRVKHLHVRAGFVEPQDWLRVREHLRPELAAACDFALACGAREMEVLGLTWKNVDPAAGVVTFEHTKTDQPRRIPYASVQQLSAVIERRLDARRQREHAGMISPYVFCFDTPVKLRGRLYHRAGDPLFGPGEHGLHTSLRASLDAACAEAQVPRLLFHDFRRSAARNYERAGVPRSVARLIGGWSDRIYSRYAIGAEGEVAAGLARASEYLAARGFGDTPVTLGKKPKEGGP
jgi:integrase